MKRYDVCIIGGGAAGLAAAASLDKDINACILEKNEIPGKKIMATGGGRCNITNSACPCKDLTLDFFRSMGLETYCDDEGRYYPYSNQASDVVKTLTRAADENHVEIITSAQVTEVAKAKDGEGFRITYGKGRKLHASSVILATGGKAAPQFGTTGDGYAVARSLGHTIERVYPVLTSLECGDFTDIKGVRAKGRVGIYKDGRLLHEETGEIQFTADGISGICVFNLTTYVKAEKGEAVKDALKRFAVKADLAPDFTYEHISRRNSSFGILSEKLASRVSIDMIKEWTLPVLGVKGWKNAQCTAGGVATEEIDMDTMESKVASGLYLAGEIIDIQGPCGGYNLQNAWETGIKAAKALNGRLR